MNDSAIQVEHVGKRYRIGKRAAYRTFGETLAAMATRPLRALGGGGPMDESNSFWALKDVSFDVGRGEVVGIIGRNGAGKSTLLKLLSRITEPTEGHIVLDGRVGSLLEVGTGFHPELTGRENIFLNGAILGMTRGEIARKFDEIVDFSEVEAFLDTPVKQYSSGMYTRLAFAVAANLEPEILIVDEVLAVGDAAFQKKCLGKISDVAREGRTVLFVSHSMATISRLCRRVILLDAGSVVIDGSTSAAIHAYLHAGTAMAAERVWEVQSTAPGDAVARLHAVRVLGSGGAPAGEVGVDEPFSIEVDYWDLRGGCPPVIPAIHVVNEEGITLFASSGFGTRGGPGGDAEVRSEAGHYRARCAIPAHLMAEGSFAVLAALVNYNPNEVHAVERDAVSFQVVDKTEGEGVRGPASNEWPGVMRPMLSWEAA